MSKFTASAHPVGGHLLHQVDVNGRHTIITDLPHDSGGNDAGPAPHELLAATLASCVSTMIVLYAQRRDWESDGIRVDVDYNADVTPRRVQTTIHLPAALTSEQAERLRRVAKSCPVRNALEAGFTFRDQLSRDVSDTPLYPPYPDSALAWPE